MGDTYDDRSETDYPDLPEELRRLADDFGKWGARRAQSAVSKARNLAQRVVKLEAELAEAWAEARKGERLREAVLNKGDTPPTLIRNWAKYQAPNQREWAEGIADALEAEGEPEPPAEPEPPCPHEEAEWRMKRHYYREGWYTCGWDCFGGPGENCRLCHKTLPPKPAKHLTHEECWERLPEIGCFVQQSTIEGYVAGGAGHTQYGDSPLSALRALVAAVEEAEDGHPAVCDAR